MTTFRWKNCFADVLTSRHDVTIHSYLDDMVMPVLAMLDAKIAELGVSGWPGHQFAKADLEVTKSEAILAFGLSIQSIWERQLRSYLRHCGNELRPGEPIAGMIDKANRKDLQKWFRSVDFHPELIWPVAWQSRQQAENAVAVYIDGGDNNVRRHSSLGSQGPIAFERKAREVR